MVETTTRTLPYGSWPSPVTAELITASSTGLGDPVALGDATLWTAALPGRAGRVSLLRRAADGTVEEVVGGDFSVRSRVHEYGGGEWAVSPAGPEAPPGAAVVVFAHFDDNRLYRVDLDADGHAAAPVALTPADPGLRYAALEVHGGLGVLLAVREDHREPGEAVTTVVLLGLDPDDARTREGGRVLCSGADFYADPTLGPLDADGARRLAWVEWDHPAMPWDATRVQTAVLDPATGERGPATQVAGGPAESAVHPGWTPTGDLLLVSDRTDWWNLYRSAGGTAEPEPLCPREAEFCPPPWTLGGRPYAFAGEDRLVCRWTSDGTDRLGVLDLGSGELTTLETDAVDVGAPSVSGPVVALALGFADRPREVALLDLAGGDWTTLARSSDTDLPTGLVSVAEPVSWDGAAGTVHAWYYPPTHPEVSGPDDERPPLITVSHGGPTSASLPTFSLALQYWTSRGFAVLDVNYGGSTGYGRPYRDRLQGAWGLVDVADCADGATAMADQGRADRERLAIRGGSAGGYTTLRALTATDVFTAGISLYGIGDLEVLARDTHKFESRYLDGLVGPYPERRDVYLERSPIHHVDELSSAILLLQGLEDAVVPPNQAELFAAAARDKGLPVALILFEGEGHGFRRPENVRASLEAQLSFLGQVFGFVPADPVEQVEIENLPAR
ncbi:dipeptidyl aminopeptidase/acylaminoacyl peptidase [Friedmanniella endophytica]|uniref:Dipeptidyl aminopeptidase/acylaminoacyl peptidase n=1 Tax=Microlunatus kandeliicorticis TaxID=1759536 RepID=A0A7W3IVA9_9ACTN|nr:prolyl oligopeptidase family serine peptidase [Microlunatus kandeliicorticis]MBA8795775.1 dipeptidyl aminopeptidase/acylaminoacyl peptidase [Microlunatus kandeliicorticis]